MTGTYDGGIQSVGVLLTKCEGLLLYTWWLMLALIDARHVEDLAKL